MDLPEESKAQRAKRKAIQALMANKSLSPAARNKQMQDIMKGNFTTGDSDAESDIESDVECEDSSSDEEYKSPSHHKSRNTGRNTSSTSRSSHNNSANSHQSAKAQAEQQKIKKKALLAISRDKSLSAKERAAKMKKIMHTSKQMSQQAMESLCEPDFDEWDNNADSFIENKKSKNRELNTLLTRIQVDDPNLRVVDLEQKNIGDALIIPLFDALVSNTHVKELMLKGNRIGNEGCVALASAILDNSTINKIDLSGNNIKDDGMKDLCKAIAYNQCLVDINLSENRFGDVGVKALAASLVENESIEVLTLNGNLIGDNGASDLFKVLATVNSTVSHLGLRMNAISDKGATAFASALIDNETLVSVDIGQNKITAKGGSDILKVLACNETLEELALDGNAGLGNDLIEEIQQVLEIKSSEEEGSSSEEEGSSSDEDSSVGSDDQSISVHGSETYEEDRQHPMISSSYQMSDKVSSSSGSNSESMTDDDDEAASNAQGGEAMLTEMPDENDTTLARRKAIKIIMQDRGLSAVERNKKIQDVMAGRVELPNITKVPRTTKSTQSTTKGKGSHGQESESESEDESGSESEGSTSSNGGNAPGGDAMLRDLPDENDAALAKRQLIQQVMRDQSLSSVEKNKNIQNIMAGRVELPVVARPQMRHRHKGRASVDGEEASRPSVSETSCSESEDASKKEATGAEAMLTDMPDESNSALAKRRAIQELMQNKSLSPIERNKKIQDILAGKVSLISTQAKSASREQSLGRIPTHPQVEEVVMEYSGRVPGESDDANAKRKSNVSISSIKKNEEVGTSREHSSSEIGIDKISLSTITSCRSENVGNALNQACDMSAHASKKEVIFESDKIATTEVERKNIRNDSTVPKEIPGKHGRSGQQNCGSSSFIQGGVASEWIQQMIVKHPKANDDLLDILLAHKYRLFLTTLPSQSSFRVVAIVFFSRSGRNERFHVVGTNDEPHSIAGSICAERAALLQLRFIPDLEAITKVVIVTDEADAISPGMLCREFMASSSKISWETPIVLGRSVCRDCGLTVSGKTCGNANDHINTEEMNLFATCTKKAGSKKMNYIIPHDFLGTVTTLKKLFPYPSIYTRLSAHHALKYGESFRANKFNHNEIGTFHENANGKELNNRSNQSPKKDSYRQEAFDLSMLTEIMNDDFNVENESSSRDNADESPDFTPMRNRRAPARLSMTGSLKKSIDFMRQIREDSAMDKSELNSSRLTLLSGSGHSEHLASKKLRISRRLKPSQRREKLIRMATDASTFHADQRQLHPIKYGAAVLFNDGTVATASQKTALEYGCTLDAVGQLAAEIIRKSMELDEDNPPCKPVLLVQCDQFGIAHAPFAQGRAFLSERGFGDCKILLHQERRGSANENGHADSDTDIHTRSIETESDANCYGPDLKLIEVSASSLVPCPPDISGGFIKKSHGLQIQF
ncbi:hypothetical protein ACHAXS_007444 [Conticribra weissflogii]